ncbi:MAG: OmpA family protein [Gammaproteobacteria bacterium]|nr:OmpA family protein [Gammaproteobacteria bacterium]
MPWCDHVMCRHHHHGYLCKEVKMKRDQNKQKIVFIAGLIVIAIVSLGGYLYNAQQNTIRAITDESQAMQQALSHELGQSRQENDQLNKSVQQLTQHQSTLKTSLAEEQELLHQLQAEVEAARAEKLQVELAMQEELQSMATVSGERSQLLDKLESEQERRRQLQQQIDLVTDDVSQRENALTGAEQAVTQLHSQLAQTREEQDQLKNRMEEVNQQRQREAQHFAQLEQRLKHELNESRFEISQLKNRMTVIKLTSEVLFNSGSAQIKPAGQKVLSLIAESLNNYPDRDINIEGHTDSVPIGKNSRYTSNWELSTARALAAVDYFQQNRQINPKRLKVVGYGEHHPVSSNETVAGRQLNRRIEIRLLPESVDPDGES